MTPTATPRSPRHGRARAGTGFLHDHRERPRSRLALHRHEEDREGVVQDAPGDGLRHRQGGDDGPPARRTCAHDGARAYPPVGCAHEPPRGRRRAHPRARAPAPRRVAAADEGRRVMAARARTAGGARARRDPHVRRRRARAVGSEVPDALPAMLFERNSTVLVLGQLKITHTGRERPYTEMQPIAWVYEFEGELIASVTVFGAGRRRARPRRCPPAHRRRARSPASCGIPPRPPRRRAAACGSGSRPASEPRAADPHHRYRQLPAARLADRPREAPQLAPAARARAGAVARRGAVPRGRRRTTPPRSPSPTRSAPGSTSSPTARSAARATPTASRPRSRASTSTTPRWSPAARAGPTRCRASSARSAARGRSRSTTCASCAPDRPHDQDHAARPVHHEPAGGQRGLRRRGGARDGPRGGGQRGGPRPVRGGRRHRADRRAVAAVARGEGARRSRSPPSTARWPARPGRPRCTRASATPTSSTTGPSGYPFLAELAGCARRRDRDRGGPAEARPARRSSRSRARP